MLEAVYRILSDRDLKKRYLAFGQRTTHPTSMSEGDMITAILKDQKFISNERARTLPRSGKNCVNEWRDC